MSNLYRPLTKLEFDEHLSVYHEQISWLRSLLIAIQSDEDVVPGYQVHDLAQIGEHLARTWLDNINERRKESGKF